MDNSLTLTITNEDSELVAWDRYFAAAIQGYFCTISIHDQPALTPEKIALYASKVADEGMRIRKSKNVIDNTIGLRPHSTGPL